MAKCAYRGADIQLYDEGIPVCLACFDNPERRRKHDKTKTSQPLERDDQLVNRFTNIYQ